ncbi:UvrD-helicase domain-containing protein [Marixanthomonas spongiae]|uniref:UvrD-helicase domain-containing protein n=1 Tax=Marixanthomonas spongiae TaxID=2174845 RepID=UPI001402D455|nr:UvrD-helicase domain-containing protein [Marixanthomonas spongiae]
MKSTQPFTIYNAAAGSGKTFTLVKAYLSKLLLSQKEGSYKNLLAITFTNKAVAEMKQRIVSNLVAFSKEASVANPPKMMTLLAADTGLSLKDIQTASKAILKHLLHHYSAFSVDTIDRFNHQLLRTFARDLKLSSNFEVSLDTEQLLAEAVDQLISKAGEDKQITNILLDFALEKTDDDKSWDIARDITKTASLLFSENETQHVEQLKERSLDDFLSFKKTLYKSLEATKKELLGVTTSLFVLLERNGLDRSCFSRGSFYDHFVKLSQGTASINFDTQWQQKVLDEEPLYTKSTDDTIKAVMDGLSSVFKEKFKDSKALFFKIDLLENILKNLTPLSVINLVQQEIENIKEEKNILPISEFNSIINKEIKNQPAPFIYERLGERYRHYFIDEFQDTSQLQWENLIPLIENALSQQIQDESPGTLLLVGDAKQSIYRWRGGKPEQFMDLYGGKSPFATSKPVVENLGTNFRSCEEIISFNNSFFTFVSQYFGDATHTQLYEVGNKQKSTQKDGGYVQIEFIEKQTASEKEEAYANLILQTIRDLKNNGYQEQDICILTRRKKEGIALGTRLMEQGISVVSSETLLLQSSPLVQGLMHILTYSLQPENEEAKINMLDFIYSHLSVLEPTNWDNIEKHTFFAQFLNKTADEVSQLLMQNKIDFHPNTIHTVSLYEAFEYCIRQLSLGEVADAYLFGFMDLVYEFEQQPLASKTAFLDYWDVKKEKASIAAAETAGAVRLMTIHKAKGLEFPVVLFPFAETDLYKEIEPKTWFGAPENEFGFKETLINFNSNVAQYSETGAEKYRLRQNTLELDNLNLLYVTLTRPVEQLYIFTEQPSKVKDRPKNFSQLFMEYLKHERQWQDDQFLYQFGEKENKEIKKEEAVSGMVVPKYINTAPADHKLNIVTKDAFLWDSETEAAILSGNRFHDIMAEITYESDASAVLETLNKRSIVTEEDFNVLKETVSAVIHHEELCHLFQKTNKVENERDLITSEGKVLRPDRLVFHPDGRVTIVDYKTGSPLKKHVKQINEYAAALSEMKFTIAEKILVYTSENGILINKA